MGHSYIKNYVHIVFSTKYRQPFIYPPVEEELHAYLGGICNRLDCAVLKVGGYTNHVHILCHLSKNIAVAKLVEEVKSHSSKWIKSKGQEYEQFYWQNGYSSFSVNPRGLDRVVTYIANQHAHHAGTMYEQELLRLFKENSVDYDERWLWD